MDRDVYVVELSDMVANAFIELNNRSKVKIIEIPLWVIEKYGEEVANKLKKSGNEIALGFYQENIAFFSMCYSDLFTIREDELGVATAVVLNDDIEIKMLFERFRACLPLRFLLACTNKKVVKRGLLDNLASETEKKKQKTLVK